MQSITYTSAQELYFNFYESVINVEVLKTAFKLDIFETLQFEYKSMDTIKRELNLKAPSRNLYDFFDKLVMLGLLVRQGIEETALYKNSHSTNNLFVKSSPNNTLILYGNCLNTQKCMFILDQYLREGPSSINNEVFTEKFFANKEGTKNFLYSMKQLSEKKFELVVDNIPTLKDYKSTIDLGGALGVLSCKMKTKYPEMHCITYDLPFVQEFAEEYLANEGFANKNQVISGDFFHDEWPKTDVVFMGNILHDWDYDSKVMLLKKVYDNLNEGGLFICSEEFIDDNREKFNTGMVVSLAMIVKTLGYNMTPSEFADLSKEVGFKKVEYFNKDVEFCIAYK